MTDSKFDEAIAPKVDVKRVSSGKERPALDWDHIRDLRSLSPEFHQLFEWVALCLADTRPYAFADFDQIQKIEKKIG